MTVDASMLRDPVFIAKVLDFIIFVAALGWVWNKYGKALLEAQQEAQNKAVADAADTLASANARLAEAQKALGAANADAARMVEVGAIQAQRLVADERATAQEHAKRIVAHADGELERERYRVRRELLEETVERAHAQARGIVERELDGERQAKLVEGMLAHLERSHV